METYFFDMISHARAEGEVLLYQNILDIETSELVKATFFLESEYKKETVSYPFTPPEFCPDASIWAAKLFYYSCQLMLYREQNTTEMITMIFPYDKEITASAILSADLTLRFIPDVLFNLRAIDDTDPLILMLEEILQIWHYSAIGYKLSEPENLKFEAILNNQCLTQLYIDRVIDRDAYTLAQHPDIHDSVQATLGIYNKELWEKFE